jgi:CBS domain-containing protein
MTVDELMTRTVVSCAPGDMLARAAQLLWERDCGCLPVLHDGRLIGIVTDRDICMGAYTKGRALHEIRVDEVMSTDVKSCSRADSIEAVQTLMQMHQLRRLPVVDHQKLVGLISLTDLAQEAESQRNTKTRELRIRQVEATLAAVSRPRQRPVARAVTA